MKRQVLTALLLFVFHVAAVSDAVSGVPETFESPDTTWRLADSDCRSLRVTRHERQFEGAHRGRGCENVQLMAGQGTHIYLVHPIPPARTIAELRPTIWVKSDRHGLQLMARVVFPRSLEHGRPITSFLFGDRYEATDTWRQLRIDDLALKLQREVVALRTQKGAGLDGREAYIDMLVLNAYTGPGQIRIWTDDLELPGFVAATAPASGDGSWPVDSVAASDDPRKKSATEIDRAEGVVLQGNVLVAAGRPIFVRAIEHRGETFALLQALGFNVVVLSSPPTESQLAEARRSDIWLVAPPAVSPHGGIIGEPSLAHDPRVMAFHLGDELTSRDWPMASERIQRVAEMEPQARPFVAHVADGKSLWRHDSLIILREHSVVHSSFDSQSLVPWLQYAQQQHRTAAPYWVAVPTEASPALQQQVRLLSGHIQAAVRVEPDQVRWLAFAAVAAGARGIWFRSRSRLDQEDATTRLRAATLRQVNRELELVAPWAAGGTAIGEQGTSNSRVSVFALQTERARLLIVLRRTADQQFVTAPVDSQQVAFTLHNPPATDQAYRLSSSGVEMLPSLRSGGLQLSLEEPEVVSLVLLTSDPLAVNYTGRTAAALRNDVAAAARESTSLLLEETEEVERALQLRGLSSAKCEQLLIEAGSQLRRADDLRDRGDSPHANQANNVATNALRRIRRSRWEQAVLGFTSPSASPLCASYALLAAHYTLSDQLSTSTWSVDLLAGGGMEHLEHLLSAGWKQSRSELPGVAADVQISIESPREGRSALYLRAWSTDPGSESLEGTHPVTITSAPVAVQAGQLLRVRGWARVPRKLDGSWDGLMISDSHSGPALAERIAETQGWREFTFYRVATTTGDWRLVFSLSGLGEAWIDHVSVTTLAQTVPVSVP